MITLRQAYKKVKKLPEHNVLMRCVDSHDKWLFEFHNTKLKPGEMLIGGGFDIVDKETGTVSSIPVFMAQDMIDRGVDLDIKQFN